MTPRQQRFVEEYARLRNGRQAALAAGYAVCCADAIASRNLRHPEITAALIEAGVELAFAPQPQTHRRVLPFLTQRQQVFVEHYLVCNNAAEAARRAGYSARSALGIASYLLRQPHIEAAIAAGNAARSERFAITAEHVLEEFAQIAFLDPATVLEEGPGGGTRVKRLDEMSAAARAALTDITVTEGKEATRVRVRLASKLRALELLARHLQLFKPALRPLSEGETNFRDELRARLQRYIAARKTPSDETG